MFRHQKNSQRDDLSIINLQENYEEDDQNNQIQFHLSSEIITIHFHQLCKYSCLFQEEFQNGSNLNSVISTLEQKFKQCQIKDENIKFFFKLLEKEQIQITSNQYIDLSKLSEIFKVNSLKKALKIYFQKNSKNPDLIINLMLEKKSIENDDLFTNDFLSLNEFEDCLINNIDKCLNIELFGQLPISTIYRIVEKSDLNKFSSDNLYDFIMNSLDDRYCLFNFLSLKKLSNEKFNDLCQNYQRLKNSKSYFEYIKNDFLYLKELRDDKHNLEQEIEQIKQSKKQTDDENSKLKNSENQMKKEIEQLKQSKKQIEDENSKLKISENQMKDEIEQTKQLKKQIEDENSKLKISENQMKDEIEQIKQLKKQIEDENSKFKTENIQLQSRIEQIENKNQQYESKIMKLEKEVKNLYDKQEKSEKEVKQRSQKVELFDYDGKSKNYFNGIISHLSQICNGNVSEKNVVNVTSSSMFDCNYPKNAVDLNNENSSFESLNKGRPDEWIMYDFNKMKIKPTFYSIRNSHNYDDSSGLMNWVIEGSNDNVQWKILDKRKNAEELKFPNFQHVFKIQVELGENERFRYLRLRTTGVDADNDYILLLSALEYFGYIYN